MISMDLKRLLDHDVEMFGLDLEAVWKVVQAFLRHCDSWAIDIGDLQVASDDEMETFRKDKPILFHLAMAYPDTSFEVAITHLLRRPRVLKHALRKTWFAWQSIHGEANLVDLLIYSTVHTMSSEALAFIRDNHDILTYDGHDDGRRKRKEGLKESWDAQMSAMPGDERRRLWILTERMFSSQMGRGSAETQGISQDRYWNRIANGRLEPECVRDQSVIRDVIQWKESGNPETIIGHFMHNEPYTLVFADLFEYGGPPNVRIRGEEVLALASRLFEALRRQVQAQGHTEQCPGFLSLRRLRNQSGQLGNYEEWLWSEIEKTIRVSLELTNELNLYWAGEKALLTNESRARLWERRQEWGSRNLRPSDLCRLLAGVPLNTLAQFVGFPDTPEQWEKCAWVGPLILECLGCCPKTIVPQAIVLLTAISQRIVGEPTVDMNGRATIPMEQVFQIMPERIKGYFPKREQRTEFVERMLARSEDEADWDPEDKKALEQVRGQLVALTEDASPASGEREEGPSEGEDVDGPDGTHPE